MSPQTPDMNTLITHAVSEAHFRTLRDKFEERRETAGESANDDERPSIPTHLLWTYLNRDADAPADFQIESALRRDADMRGRAARMLKGRAVASSDMAMAAATGEIHTRVIGDFQLRLVESSSARMLVLSPANNTDLAPTMLEAIGEAGHVRIRLPLPVRGSFQIPLDEDDDDLGRLDTLLRATDTELYLL